jgi:hypothetical protein
MQDKTPYNNKGNAHGQWIWLNHEKTYTLNIFYVDNITFGYAIYESWGGNLSAFETPKIIREYYAR